MQVSGKMLFGHGASNQKDPDILDMTFLFLYMLDNVDEFHRTVSCQSSAVKDSE